ncbi:MAG: hypothetical protein JSS02_35425 [Planctomycetes bacterium]|nr:hypothetical protein [Planctomycetota bacterium]
MHHNNSLDSQPTFMRIYSHLKTLALLSPLMSAAPAFGADKLYYPYVTRGELEVEYFGSRSNDSDSSKDNAQKRQVSIGYGVTDWWKPEVYGNFEREPGGKVTFDAWEWENIFQLTNPGQYWLDLGASIAYEYTPQTARPDTIETRLLLAKDVGQLSHVLNVIVEKDVGSGDKADLESTVLWSSRYRWFGYFEPGIEISSDFGELRHSGSFDDQKHAIGPFAYGKIPLGLTDRADGLKYRVGYLVGVSQAAPSGEASAQLEYEVHF